LNIKKNIISNLFLVSTFLMPLFNNSLLIADINKEEKSNIENEFNQDDINIWLKILKNAVHINAIAATIIRDIFGNFDMAEAGQIFINNMLKESKKRKEN